MNRETSTPISPRDKLQPIRVLLIEDNPGDALLMQEWVSETAGDRFSMECEGRLAAGIDRLREEEFDLVVLDLSLPDSRGWKTFVEVRKHSPQIPLIVLSGLDDEALALKTVQEGAQDYLVKGQVDGPSLVRAMRYAVERRQAEKALAEERNLLRILLDSLPDPIYVKDKEGRYLMDNEEHMRLLKAESKGEVLNKTVFDFFPPEIAEKYQADDGYVLRTGSSVINRSECHRLREGKEKWVLTTKVPLRDTEGKVWGLVGISRDITERKKAEEQLAHYNLELRKKNEQLEADQRMAREIQQALLPNQYPTFPHNVRPEESALQFCHCYRPTELVGGDFYHVLALSDTEAGIFISDVMGHGVRSALVTAILRTVVEESASVAHNPGRFLHEINRSLSTILTRTGTLMFATAFYVIADVSRNELRFSNAGGHPPPLRIRRESGEVEPIVASRGSPGPALGLLEDAVYATSVSDLMQGDRLFFFTDGIFEVEGADGENYDQHRLAEAVKAAIDLPVQDLFDNLLSEIQRYAAAHAFIDDICLVGMEVRKTGFCPEAKSSGF